MTTYQVLIILDFATKINIYLIHFNIFCIIPTVIYHDYKDAYSKGAASNGVYLVQPDTLPPFDVFCDVTTYGGGWTVFEKRENGSVDFYTEWGEYENGFGQSER